MNRWLAVCAGVLIGIADALASPSFSRKYNVSCTTCHVIIPQNNAFGWDYRERGYVMPEALEQNREVVELDENSFIDKFSALAVRIKWYPISHLRQDPNNNYYITSALPEEAEFMYYTRIAKFVSIKAAMIVAEGTAALEKMFVNIHGPRNAEGFPFVNLMFGSNFLTDFSAGLDIEVRMTRTKYLAYVYGLGELLAGGHPQINLWGRPHKSFFYQVGITTDFEPGVDPVPDLVARGRVYTHHIGLPFAGAIGGVAYVGREGGIEFQVFGPEITIDHSLVHLRSVFLFGSYGNQDFLGGFAEVFLTPHPMFFIGGRYDLLNEKANALDKNGIVGYVGLVVSPNMNITLEYGTYMDNATGTSYNEIASKVEVAY